MVELNDKKYPKSWKELSFDFKLFFAFHGSMMVLMIVGRTFSIEALIGVVVFLLLVLTTLSFRHRNRSDWHWPGVGFKGILGSIFSVVLGLFFLGAVTPRISPLQPTFFPWFAAGGGIILFGVLSALKVVCQTETEFQNYCGSQDFTRPEKQQPKPTEVRWKMVVRRVYAICFFAVWIVGVSFFWKFNTAFANGTPVPTMDKTETLTDHGKMVYITPQEQKILSLLENMLIGGVPSIILLGALLHYRAGVKLIPNLATLAEMKDQPHQQTGDDKG